MQDCFQKFDVLFLLEEIEHRTSENNPALTSVVGKYKISHELKDRTLDFHQNVEFKSDEENFYLVFHRWVLVNGELFREKVWEETIPRDCLFPNLFSE